LSSFLLLAPLVPAAFTIYLSGVTLSVSALANLIRLLAGAAAAAVLYAGYRVLELVLSGRFFVLTIPAVEIFYENGVMVPVHVSPLEISVPMALVFSIYIVGALSFYAGTRLLDQHFLP
jgi:hypothetical protein